MNEQSNLPADMTDGPEEVAKPLDLVKREQEAYILESGDVEIPPVSDEVWEDRFVVRKEFLVAWGRPSRFTNALSQLPGDSQTFLGGSKQSFGEYLSNYS